MQSCVFSVLLLNAVNINIHIGFGALMILKSVRVPETYTFENHCPAIQQLQPPGLDRNQQAGLLPTGLQLLISPVEEEQTLGRCAHLLPEREGVGHLFLLCWWPWKPDPDLGLVRGDCGSIIWESGKYSFLGLLYSGSDSVALQQACDFYLYKASQTAQVPARFGND